MTPDIKTILKYGKVLCFDFAKDGCPQTGVAYWRYTFLEYNGKYWIVEAHVVNGKLQNILKEAKVGML